MSASFIKALRQTEPMPNWPNWLSPQAHTVLPSAERASEWAPPAATRAGDSTETTTSDERVLPWAVLTVSA